MKKLFIVLLSISLCSCASLTKPYPMKTKYMLQAAPATRLTQKPLDASISVLPAVTNPPFNKTEFIYHLDEGRYTSDFYNVFFADPDIQITNNIITSLKESGLFKTVNTRALLLPGAYELKSMVSVLEANYTNTALPSGDIAIEFILLKDNKIIFDRPYKMSIPLTTKSSAALVVAWDEALSSILRQFEYDLSLQLLPQTTAIVPVVANIAPSVTPPAQDKTAVAIAAPAPTATPPAAPAAITPTPVAPPTVTEKKTPPATTHTDDSNFLTLPGYESTAPNQ